MIPSMIFRFCLALLLLHAVNAGEEGNHAVVVDEDNMSPALYIAQELPRITSDINDPCTQKYKTDVCGCWEDPKCGFCREIGNSLALTYCISGDLNGPALSTDARFEGVPIGRTCPQAAAKDPDNRVVWESVGDGDACRAALLLQKIMYAAAGVAVVVVVLCYCIVRGQYVIRAAHGPPPHKTCCMCGKPGRKQRALKVAPLFPQNPCRYFCSTANLGRGQFAPGEDPHPAGCGCACRISPTCGCPASLVRECCEDQMPEDQLPAVINPGCAEGIRICLGGKPNPKVMQQQQMAAQQNPPGQTPMSVGPNNPHHQQQPPLNNGYPPQQQGGYPPQQQGGYPPQQQGGYPPQQGGYPPQQGGYPPQQGGYPPQQQGGYPPQQQGYGNYPPQQQGPYNNTYPPPS